MTTTKRKLEKKFLITILASTLLLSVGCWETKNKPAEQNTNQANALKAEDIKDLYMQEITVGNGKEAVDGKTVSVNYRGTFLDGKEFDSSYSRNKPFEFKLGSKNVIEGWEIGVKGMKVGGKRVLVVPPQMAYGEKGSGPIPPNTPLKFEIELLDVK